MVRMEQETATAEASPMVTTQRNRLCHRRPVSRRMESSSADTEILPAATPRMPKTWLSQSRNCTTARLSIPSF